MALSRVISRLLIPGTWSRLSMIGNVNGSIRHFFYRHPKYLPDVFGSTLNIFRDLEREFERMQRQFDNYFRNQTGINDRSLVSFPRSGTSGEKFWSYLWIIYVLVLFLEGDMIITEVDGSRKFQLTFNMREFEPEEVKIKTQNGRLTISAKKEKKARLKLCI